jgi:hypothetical protein
LPLRSTIKSPTLKREITLRRRAYPRFVEAKRMTQERADRQIETMEAVLETLLRVKHGAPREDG